MKYIYLGATMLIVSTVLAWILFGWQMALIVFLAVQGNEIVQHHNSKLNKQEGYEDNE